MSTTYTFGSYTCVQFTTADGSFTWTPPSGVTSYDVLIVAGAGSGGRSANGGGGGGAGGLLWLTAQSCTPGVGISGSVGAGGATKTTDGNGNNGTNSAFGSSTAIGGGGGAGVNVVGVDGGSGGGGAPGGAGVNWAGGAGTSGQGNAGGSGAGNSSAGQRAAGGGGGKGGAGDNAGTLRAGLGGAGFDATALVGTSVGDSGWFASGGGGGSCSDTPESTSGNVSSGGGGVGGRGDSSRAPAAGMANTGGGGGGGGGNDSSGSDQTNGAAGGSGVVIVRYVTPVDTLTVAAQVNQPTADFDLAGFNASNLSVSAQVNQPAASFTLEGFNASDLTVAAQVNQPVADFDLTATPVNPQLSVAAQVNQPVADFDLTAELASDLSVAAQVNQPVADFDLDVTPISDTLTVAAQVNQPTITFVLAAEVTVGTDTTNTDDGVYLGDGIAQVVWTPGVESPPAHVASELAQVRTVAVVVDTAPAALPDFTPGVGREQSTDAPRVRLLIGDRDATYYGDAPVEVGTVNLIDPLLYGSADITLPGVNPQYHCVREYDEDGNLAAIVHNDDLRIAVDDRVRLQLVVDGEVTDDDWYIGFVSRINVDDTKLRLDLGGDAAGRLSGYYVPPFVYRRRQEVDHILVDTLRKAGVRAGKLPSPSGFTLVRRGGTDGLSIFNETLAVWAGARNTPYTYVPSDDGAYRRVTKDTTTIHATAYPDSGLITQSIALDMMEAQNARRVYMRGFTNGGELVANIKTPGLTQGDPLPFPLVSGSLTEGMTDADTTSLAGVTSLQQQLVIHDYLDWADASAGVYDEAVTEAVEDFQHATGLSETGNVNLATWNRLWSLDKIGYSLDGAGEYPTAEDPRMRKWDLTANGSKAARNPKFKRGLPPNDQAFDAGGPFKRRQLAKFARSKLGPAGGAWTGQLTFKSGLVRGEHNPGEAFTAADVMHRFELRPNMNVWLPHLMGGMLVTVTHVAHNPGESTVLVSTHPATSMETWQAIERRREDSTNPGRTYSGHTRSSQVRVDEGALWDTHGGWLANDVDLGAGWNEVVVPVGQAGIVQQIRMTLADAMAFAVLITQKTVSVDALNNNAHTGTPLDDPRPVRPWFEQQSVITWLESREYLYAWGTELQPCGYDPSKKTDDLGSTGQSPTGKFFEEAGFNYETHREPVLYLYVYVDSPTTLLAGRILRKQETRF